MTATRNVKRRKKIQDMVSARITEIGLTQEELASEMEISPGTLRNTFYAPHAKSPEPQCKRAAWLSERLGWAPEHLPELLGLISPSEGSGITPVEDAEEAGEDFALAAAALVRRVRELESEVAQLRTAPKGRSRTA